MVKFTFRKEERIHLDREFQKILRYGEAHSDGFFKIFVYRNAVGNRCSRLGLIVSGKLGAAVSRNRLKRRLRDVFRLNKHGFIAKSDIIIIPKKNCLGLKYAELREKLTAGWKRLGLLQ